MNHHIYRLDNNHRMLDFPQGAYTTPQLFPPFNGKLKQKLGVLHAFADSQSAKGVKNDLPASHPS